MTSITGVTHLAMGDTGNGAFSEGAVTRTALVLGHGAWQNTGTMVILGGVVTRDNSDALLTGKYDRVHWSMIFTVMTPRGRGGRSYIAPQI